MCRARVCGGAGARVRIRLLRLPVSESSEPRAFGDVEDKVRPVGRIAPSEEPANRPVQGAGQSPGNSSPQ